jgi:hypothetical protein
MDKILCGEFQKNGFTICMESTCLLHKKMHKKMIAVEHSGATFKVKMGEISKCIS